MSYPTIPAELQKRMMECQQDPEWHAEGDVWTHTMMVVAAMLQLVTKEKVPEPGDRVLLGAADYHDIGKPVTSRVEDGRIVTPNHGKVGSKMTRAIWYRAGTDAAEREMVCGLIRHHQVLFHLLDQDPARALKRLARTSLECRLDWLVKLAMADLAGRVKTGKDDASEQLELALELVRENRCLTEPVCFPSDHTRFMYFRGEHDSIERECWDDTLFDVTLMSGLPASGKDTWIRKNAAGLAVVSLDEIRADLGAEGSGWSEEMEGRVQQEAKRRAQELLRKRQTFVFNATHVTEQSRASRISLFKDYRVRTRIVHVEAPYQTILARNRLREGNARVPEAAIERMIDKWEMPVSTEAHRVEVVQG